MMNEVVLLLFLNIQKQILFNIGVWTCRFFYETPCALQCAETVQRTFQGPNSAFLSSSLISEKVLG